MGETAGLRIHNTLSRTKEAFDPADPANVRLYVCGPTVYDLAHIGNARPVVVFDVLVRLLRHLYGADHVTYVRNITDVDDKINARARESGRSIRAITEDTAAVFHEDMAALGALPPDVEPRATDHVPEMITLIERLIEKDNAYEADGHVLFHVPSMPDYGGLSRRDRDELIAGARVDVAPYKRDPADFVLWKPSNDDQPGWDSPWGRGRPGWHIECSAMSWKYLGETFDIHGGGADLIFPHHENELAQSRCAHGTDIFARYWMHNGYLMAEGEKMSKSLGNFYTVHELLGEYPGEAIRLLLLKTHYRQPLDFTKEGLAEAREELNGFYQALRATSDVETAETAPPPAVVDALLDDVNTPQALARLHETLTALNKAESAEAKTARKSELIAGASLLGLLGSEPEAWFRWRPSASRPVDDLSDDAIDELVTARTAARKNKDFAAADRIRDELQAKGIVLEDGAGGTTWRRA